MQDQSQLKDFSGTVGSSAILKRHRFGIFQTVPEPVIVRELVFLLISSIGLSPFFGFSQFFVTWFWTVELWFALPSPDRCVCLLAAKMRRSRVRHHTRSPQCLCQQLMRLVGAQPLQEVFVSSWWDQLAVEDDVRCSAVRFEPTSSSSLFDVWTNELKNCLGKQQQNFGPCRTRVGNELRAFVPANWKSL